LSSARAQTRTARVGVLLLGAAAAPKDLSLPAELAKLGYVEGRNIAFEVRGASEDLGRLPALARELAATRPDALVGATSPGAVALAGATKSIPVLMTVVGDPIALGLTNSMSRPSGNVTGFTLSSPTLAGKRLELLRELNPNLRKVAYLRPTTSPMITTFEQQVRNAAASFGITLVFLSATTEAAVADAFALADREQVQAVLVETNPTNVQLGGHIMNECLVRDLPAMHAWLFEVRAGALMSYGPATLENHAGVAGYFDRIVKGAKVFELPFQEPTQIKLVINLRTARSIGLTIPPTLLARADEVIE
jgi:putative ABC transport system substrate-binding protein